MYLLDPTAKVLNHGTKRLHTCSFLILLCSEQLTHCAESYCSIGKLWRFSDAHFSPLLQVYVNQVCEDVFSGPLNSPVQLAGLRLLTNMTVTNDHQHMFTTHITDLFQVLLSGNGTTKVRRKQWLLEVQRAITSSFKIGVEFSRPSKEKVKVY